MPLEMHLWRIDGDRTVAVIASGIGEEERLESIIVHEVEILGLGSLMLVGRQVITDHGSRIDLLALDEDGTLYVIELKRSRTPREVVAQALDYGSWVRRLSAERLAHIFETRSSSPAIGRSTPPSSSTSTVRSPRSSTKTTDS